MKDMKIYVVSVLKVIASEMMYHRKTGVFPSQKRILAELNKKFGITRSPRTYNRWAAVMESCGLLRRTKRHKKDSRFGWTFRSSLSTIPGPGWKILINAGHYTWDHFRDLIKEATATFRKPKKTRKVERSSGSLTHVGEVIKDLGFDTS